MRWITRINTILSANVHEALDRFENPRKQLEQAVREMEAALQRTVQRAVRVLAEEKMLAKRTAECESRVEAWQERAERAVREGDEAAARVALRRKLEAERLHESLLDQLEQLRNSNARLKQQISEMRDSLRTAKAKRATLVARYTAAKVKQEAVQQCQDVELDNGAFATFQRMAERIERGEAEADAWAELLDDDISVEARETADDAAVDAELEALKASLAKHPSPGT